MILLQLLRLFLVTVGAGVKIAAAVAEEGASEFEAGASFSEVGRDSS